MRQLNIHEIQHVSGSGVFLTAAAVTVAAGTLGSAAFGIKAVAMAPIALALGTCATIVTSVSCIPVGLFTGNGLVDTVSKTFNHFALGPYVGWELQKKAL